MSELIEALLDMNLDDLEDLPEFKSFPAGGYKLGVSLKAKTVNDKPAVEMSLKMLEVIELADTSLEPPKEGDESSILFFMDNEIGRGKMKEACKPIAVALNTPKLTELVEQCQDVEVMAILTTRPDKEDKDKIYQGVKELEVI